MQCDCAVPGSYDSSVRVWDCRARTYDPIQVLNEAKDSISSLQLTASEILTGYVCQYNVHKRVNLSLISTLLKLVCYEHVFPCIYMYNSSVDGQVRRYDLRFGKLHTDTISSKQLYIE